jgi:predicted RNA-binding Zn-ribbon protein involved in translation (DUF1610 family)
MTGSPRKPPTTGQAHSRTPGVVSMVARHLRSWDVCEACASALSQRFALDTQYNQTGHVLYLCPNCGKEHTK